MDAPPDLGAAINPFLTIAALLQGRGFSPPEIYASDKATGLILMEDLGDALFSRVADQEPEQAPKLYAGAVDVLVALHRMPPPNDLPSYTHEDMASRASLSVTWYLPGTGGSPNAALASEVQTEVSHLLQRYAAAHDVIALRDFHAENLLWLPERTGVRRVGLLDFQDAMASHPAYDLVSLLEDARRDVSHDLAAAMIARHVSATGADVQEFETACAVLAAQRNLRILGVFARLCLHFGKPQYVALLPRVWAHLKRGLTHPALEGLRRIVDDAIPEPTRARRNAMTAATGSWPLEPAG